MNAAIMAAQSCGHLNTELTGAQAGKARLSPSRRSMRTTSISTVENVCTSPIHSTSVSQSEDRSSSSGSASTSGRPIEKANNGRSSPLNLPSWQLPRHIAVRLRNIFTVNLARQSSLACPPELRGSAERLSTPYRS